MIYDMIIVGGGPAGLTAAIYGARAGKKVLVLERLVIGGQIAPINKLENYPGLMNISGFELAMKMHEQATFLGAETVYADVLSFSLLEKIKKLTTTEGTFEAKAIILCLGASSKQLNISNEKKFIGKGISYCATCDGNFFKNKAVAVVGGGNTSLDDVLYLSDLASKVYLIHRRQTFRADGLVVEKVKALSAKGKIEFCLDSEISAINGENNLEKIEIKNKITGVKREIAVEGLFVAVGRKPDTDLLNGIIALDENQYIITGEKMQTNISGVFAAGDVVKKHVRQIVTACSEGAIAATSANDYILENF